MNGKARSISRRIRAAGGKGEADLVIKNASVVDVFRKKIIPSHVAVKDGYIVGMGDYRGRRIIDVEGRYLAPGFIDGHTHIESTFLSPQEFGRLCLTSAVTTVVADPHEIANVYGIAGVEWMIEMVPHSPMRIFYTCPSCVPSSPLESPGGRIGLEEMEALKGREEIVALGEVMDYPGLMAGKKELIRKIALFDGFPLEGHAPGLRGIALSAYRASGVSSDHEAEDPGEAEEKLSYGFHVMVREGSVARNLTSLLPFLKKYQGSCRVSIVSDDLSISDMAKRNYLGRVLARGVRMGIDPVNLIRMVTVNTAARFNFWDMGAVAPGFRADLAVFENLRDFVPHMVLVGGRVGYRRGRPVGSVTAPVKPEEKSVTLPPDASPSMLRVRKGGTRLKVIKVTPGLLHNVIDTVPSRLMRGKYASSLPAEDLVKVCVIERHGGRGRIGKGFVKGLGLKSGALGLTFAHDAHNLVLAGVDDGAMYEVAGMVSRAGGGIAAITGKGEKAVLPMEIGGIISSAPWEHVAAGMERVREVCEMISHVGLELVNILSFIALPVIPEGRITDRGFIDVGKFRRTSIWE